MNKNVVPIVVQGSRFPPEELPSPLLPLAAVQSFVLDPLSGFDQSMRRLVKILEKFGAGVGFQHT
jgi:hypothetical protein